MYRLLIDGIEIELEQNTNVSFLFENSLFMFEKMKLNRTTQFKIPRTPTNDNIFDFAHLPEYSGEKVRRNAGATLYYSNGVLEGEILITDYSDKNYNAVFIYGNLLGIRKLREVGKLSEALSLNKSVYWGSTTPNLPPRRIIDYGMANYFNFLSGTDDVPDKINILPSIRCKYILGKITDDFRIRFDFSDIESYIHSIFFKVNSRVGTFDQQGYLLTFIQATGNATIAPFQNDPRGTTLQVSRRNFTGYDGKIISKVGLKANNDCVFDIDFTPSLQSGGNLGILVFNKNMNYYESLVGGVNVNTPAQQLAKYNAGAQMLQRFNRISMKKGDEIYWERANAHVSFPPTNNPHVNNFVFFQPIPFTIQYYAIQNITTSTNDAPYNSTLKLIENAPDITVIEFIKLLKGISGYGLIFSLNTIEFYNYDFGSDGHFAGRVNTTGTYSQKLGRFIHSGARKGMADVTAVINGLHVSIEVKTGNDKLRPEQMKVRDEVKAAGGVYMVVTSFDNFMEQIKLVTA